MIQDKKCATAAMRSNGVSHQKLCPCLFLSSVSYLPIVPLSGICFYLTLQRDHDRSLSTCPRGHCSEWLPKGCLFSTDLCIWKPTHGSVLCTALPWSCLHLTPWKQGNNFLEEGDKAPSPAVCGYYLLTEEFPSYIVRQKAISFLLSLLLTSK